MLNRLILDCLADRQFGKAEMKEVLAFFGQDEPSCVFCGATPIDRWDHLIPVIRGGDTVLGNIVPACSKCDDSKRDLLFEEWARSTAPGSPGLDSVAFPALQWGHGNQAVHLLRRGRDVCRLARRISRLPDSGRDDG